MSENEKPAKVMVLMATCDGAAHLEEQLNSLAGQTWPAIDIRVSDDGSTDGTMAILRRWREKWAKGEFTIVEGPHAGFAENFRSLITAEVDAPFYAFCDQDDLWEPDKLARAIAWLGERGSTPRLFCSRTLTITEDGRAVGHSPLFARPPSFRNALVQSIAGGNTMVLNRPARDAVARACARSGFVSHDWWAYLIVTGAGGAVEYCAEPLVRYRQHALNLVGANSTFAARIARLRRLFRGEFARWHDTNLDCLEKNADLLTPEAAAILELFRNARNGGVFSRLRNLRASGVYRQTRPGEIALYAAAILGRL
jgi:glycosyltransferase involved in cell wall biosynthesis